MKLKKRNLHQAKLYKNQEKKNKFKIISYVLIADKNLSFNQKKESNYA